MTREEIERKLEVFCSTPIEGEFKFIIEYLLSECERLEERQKWIDEVARPDHPDDERPWCAAYLDCRARVKELEEGIEKLIDWLMGATKYERIEDIPDKIWIPFTKLIEKEK